MKEFCEKAAYDLDVWYATNIEVEDYVSAMRKLIFDVNQTVIYNVTSITEWSKLGLD